MENAPISWNSAAVQCASIEVDHVVFQWRCLQPVARGCFRWASLCHAFPVSTHLSVHSSSEMIDAFRWPSLLSALPLLITGRTDSIVVGGSSSERCWADSPTLFRSSASCFTPADCEEEDLLGLFIETGMRQKVCVFSRARPGEDALE